MEKIYLLKTGKIMLGPYTLEQLREKIQKPSDLIWFEGLADWTPAGNIFNLKDMTRKEHIVQDSPKKSFLDSIKKLFFGQK